MYRCLYQFDRNRIREASRRGRAEGSEVEAEDTRDNDGNRRQPTTDFAQQVAGIMALPLTDAEKTECIRWLLAAQPRKGV